MPNQAGNAALALAFLLFAGATAAGEIHLYVATRTFLVSVAPVDAASRDADTSVLYQRPAGDGDWLALGSCDNVPRPDGDIRFTLEVTVPTDGTYHYTSRPIVGGEVVSPPDADAPPQAVVVVDTLPPMAEIIAPRDDAKVPPGGSIEIAWETGDENIVDAPVTLAFTTDSGKSWTAIATDLPAKGGRTWTAPPDLAGPALVRLTAVDKAGNLARDIRRLAGVGGLRLADEPQPPETAVAAPPPLPPEPEAETLKARNPNRSWLYYLMAVNLMRQNKPADALQYYWLSVKEDPEFIDAWADIGLAYIDLGAFRTAREVLTETRGKAPERIDLMHLMGETYHAEGMNLLEQAGSAEDRVRAKGLVDQAVEWYGRALAKASGEWRLAEQAPSFYRLGEICYYVNMDRHGARAYWKKILELHTPTPNPDLILWSPREDRDKARRRHQKYTHMRVSLDAWQNWARGYIEQLDARERAGIVELMPAQKITAMPCEPSLPYANTPLNPGRDDGRSLFSLPSELGSPGEAEACSATAGPAARPASPAYSSQNPAAKGYSFYGSPERASGQEVQSGGRARGGNSVFTGGPDLPPPPNPDPYAFPQGGRTRPAWHGMGAYGDKPLPE